MPNRRPSLTLMGSAASDEEAAAVIAAVERFLRDTTPATAPAAERVNPWLRAGLLEATGRETDGRSPWGDPHPWGASSGG